MADDAIETGPANVAGGVMSLEPGTAPGARAKGSRLSKAEPEMIAADVAGEMSFKPGAIVSGPNPDMSAADRLRAFEDKVLGPDAPRLAGKVERGSGSLYNRMEPADKARHRKIEMAAAAEERMSGAQAALSQARAEYEAAMKAVSDALADD